MTKFPHLYQLLYKGEARHRLGVSQAGTFVVTQVEGIQEVYEGSAGQENLVAVSPVERKPRRTLP